MNFVHLLVRKARGFILWTLDYCTNKLPKSIHLDAGFLRLLGRLRANEEMQHFFASVFIPVGIKIDIEELWQDGDCQNRRNITFNPLLLAGLHLQQLQELSPEFVADKFVVSLDCFSDPKE